MFPGILQQILAALGIRFWTDGGPAPYGRAGSAIVKADTGAALSVMPRFLKITAITDGANVAIDVLDPDGSGNMNTLTFPAVAVGDVIEFNVARVRTTTTATFVAGY